MAQSKLVNANKKIADGVGKCYKKVEDTVVNCYKKVEDTVVDGYKNIEDKFVEKYLTKDGESVSDAKKRLKEEEQKRKIEQEK